MSIPKSGPRPAPRRKSKITMAPNGMPKIIKKPRTSKLK